MSPKPGVADRSLSPGQFVRWPLIFAATFTVFWSIHRALVQSITFDEANTFLDFVAPGWAFSWTPWSNNHVLNTLLMQACVSLFGAGQLTVRLPALAGGALYVVAAYRICALLCRSWTIAVPLFVCLVLNPFVMDYYVAARGYGLAMGFFATALWLSAEVLIHRESLPGAAVTRYSLLASACGALSISANFSFAYANVFLVAMVVGWASVPMSWRGGVRLALGAASIAAAILLVIAGPMLLRFPKQELYWGAKSLGEMWTYIGAASYPSLSPALPAMLVASLQPVQPFLAAAIIATTFGYFVVTIAGKRRAGCDGQGRVRLSLSLTAVLILTLLAHWLQFVILGLPLPRDRTSLFIAPLVTLICGAILAVTPASRLGSVARLMGVMALSASAIYFVSALRDDYFQEWPWYGSDAKSAFPVLAEACGRTGSRNVPVDWKYAPSFKFYQFLQARPEIDGFSDIDTDRIPQDRVLYVVPSNQYQDFVRFSGLSVIFRGQVGGILILERDCPAGPHRTHFR